MDAVDVFRLPVLRPCRTCGRGIVPKTNRRYCTPACRPNPKRPTASPSGVRACSHCQAPFLAVHPRSHLCPPCRKRRYSGTCRHCGATFWASSATTAHCSQACGFAAQRDRQPDREQLRALLETHTLQEIGRRYHVTRECVRQWAVQRGLVVRESKYARDASARWARKLARRPWLAAAVQHCTTLGWTCTDAPDLGTHTFRAGPYTLRVHEISRAHARPTTARSPYPFVHIHIPRQPRDFELYHRHDGWWVLPKAFFLDRSDSFFLRDDQGGPHAHYREAWPVPKAGNEEPAPPTC